MQNKKFLYRFVQILNSQQKTLEEYKEKKIREKYETADYTREQKSFPDSLALAGIYGR